MKKRENKSPSRSAKRALTSSVLALVLCFVMLLGTTFAWFTDTASTKVNTIQAGNLDIGLYWTDSLNAEKTDDGADATEWNNAEDGEAIFDYDKWEPGYTDIKYIKIVNNGNLAFKWKMNIVPLGDVGVLADVIDVYYATNQKSNITDRALTGMTKINGTLSDVIEAEDIKVQGVLLPSGTEAEGFYAGEIVVAVALKMQETAGNEYQGKSIGENGFTIQLYATQYTYESDSTDNTYDAMAEYATGVSSADGLKTAIANGQNVVLSADIDDTIEIDSDISNVTIDCNGYSAKLDFDGKLEDVVITNLVYDGNENKVLDLGDASGSVTVTNSVISGDSQKGTGVIWSMVSNHPDLDLTFEDCVIEGGRPVYVSHLGDLIFKNCTFKNAETWVILSQSGKPDNVTVDGCSFINCTQGLVKIQGGTMDSFTFTNNTLDDFSANTAHNGKTNNVFDVKCKSLTFSGNVTEGGTEWTTQKGITVGS